MSSDRIKSLILRLLDFSSSKSLLSYWNDLITHSKIFEAELCGFAPPWVSQGTELWGWAFDWKQPHLDSCLSIEVGLFRYALGTFHSLSWCGRTFQCSCFHLMCLFRSYASSYSPSYSRLSSIAPQSLSAYVLTPSHPSHTRYGWRQADWFWSSAYFLARRYILNFLTWSLCHDQVVQ